MPFKSTAACKSKSSAALEDIRRNKRTLRCKQGPKCVSRPRSPEWGGWLIAAKQVIAGWIPNQRISSLFWCARRYVTIQNETFTSWCFHGRRLYVRGTTLCMKHIHAQKVGKFKPTDYDCRRQWKVTQKVIVSRASHTSSMINFCYGHIRKFWPARQCRYNEGDRYRHHSSSQGFPKMVHCLKAHSIEGSEAVD